MKQKRFTEEQKAFALRQAVFLRGRVLRPYGDLEKLIFRDGRDGAEIFVAGKEAKLGLF